MTVLQHLQLKLNARDETQKLGKAKSNMLIIIPATYNRQIGTLYYQLTTCTKNLHVWHVFFCECFLSFF